jgi:hypothetical protein
MHVPISRKKHADAFAAASPPITAASRVFVAPARGALQMIPTAADVAMSPDYQAGMVIKDILRNDWAHSRNMGSILRQATAANNIAESFNVKEEVIK